MNKILTASLFNILKDQEVVDIHFKSQVTILTGYNGVGKSTILASLHSTISLLNSNEYLFPRTNWASRLSISGDFHLNHFKIPNPSAKGINVSTILEEKKLGDDLKDIFNFILEESKRSETDGLVLSNEGEKRDSKSTNLMYIEKFFLPPTKRKNPSRYLSGRPEIKSVLYCDELFNFNNNIDRSDKLDELDIFSKKNTLDKTLYLLLNDLSAKSPHLNEVDEIKKIISELDLFISSKNISFDIAMKERIKGVQRKLQEAPHSAFIDEANKFFKMTGREVFLNDRNLLSLKIQNKDDKEVVWFNLSKGEKTLLCLLLIAYLYNDENNVFLFDEPDLSLHIQWQKQLIRSLITLAPKSQFIISTHSPALIGHVEQETIINVGSYLKK